MGSLSWHDEAANQRHISPGRFMPETTPTILARIAATVPALLRTSLGQEVQVVEVQLLKDATRTVVARVALSPGAWAPTVIVKVIRDDAATGFSEWAALAFLSQHAPTQGMAPTFLGGDLTQRMFVMEDLGPGRSLHEVLTDGSAGEAARALAQLARQMARLHGLTLGTEGVFEAIRATLPAGAGLGRAHEAAAWQVATSALEHWLAAIGSTAPSGLGAVCAAVADVYAAPGPWLSFSHGDPAPSNNHLAGDRVRLLDFEYGAVRHALYDLSAWNILCPLPASAVVLMQDAFRAELGAWMPEARDAATFAAAWATLCAYRGLALLSWVAPAVLAADRPMVGAWSARQAVLAAVSRTAAATVAVPALAPITAATAQLRVALGARWPELGSPDILATNWAALRQGT
jgi:hypothetical protein